MEKEDLPEYDDIKWLIIMNTNIICNILLKDEKEVTKIYKFNGYVINKWLEENQIDIHNMSDEDTTFINMRFPKPKHRINNFMFLPINKTGMIRLRKIGLTGGT